MFDDFEVKINLPDDMDEFYRVIAEFTFEVFSKQCPKDLQPLVIEKLIERASKLEETKAC